MPDIGYVPSVEVDIGLRHRWRARQAVLVAAILAGALLAAPATPAEEAGRAAQAAGPDLTRLLRAMAVLKLIFAAGALAATYWRLAAPASTWRLTSYAAAGAAMAAGPVLICGMVHVPLGALLLHGGLLAGTLLLWRDPAVNARLGAMVPFRQLFRARLQAQHGRGAASAAASPPRRASQGLDETDGDGPDRDCARLRFR